MHFSFTWLFLLGIPLLHATENRGIKMKVQNDQAGLSNQRTVYWQGDRKRVEFRNASGRKGTDESLQEIYGPRIVSITRCDLGQSFELNLDASEYSSRPYPPKPLTPEEIKARGLQNSPKYVSEKPTLRIEVTTADTGERKEMFGHMARHVITTRKQTPLEGSHSEPQESVTDGWYIDSKSAGSKDGDSKEIDLNQQLSCDRKWPTPKKGHAYSYAILANGSQPREKPEFVTIGEPETGFAVQTAMTSKNTYTQQDGTRKQSASKFEMHVVELEDGPLDPSLFEIPPGFKQVDHIEHNAAGGAFAGQPPDFWQRFKDNLAILFSR